MSPRCPPQVISQMSLSRFQQRQYNFGVRGTWICFLFFFLFCTYPIFLLPYNTYLLSAYRMTALCWCRESKVESDKLDGAVILEVGDIN